MGSAHDVDDELEEVVRVDKLDLRMIVDDCERLEPLVSIPMLETASAAHVVAQALLEDNEVAIVNIRLLLSLCDHDNCWSCESSGHLCCPQPSANGDGDRGDCIWF